MNDIDKEILNYLMTSEFTDGFTKEELIGLVKEFRYFYRLKQSQVEQKEYKIDKLIKDLEIKDFEIKNLKKIISDKNKELDNVYNKKLTMRERITGKLKSKNK